MSVAMPIKFSPQARAEFKDGEAYYEQQVLGLGGCFRTEVREALVRIRRWPLAAPLERGDVRRMVLSRFPYKILYSIEPDCLYIIALAHQHRAPAYWADRKPS